MTDVYLVRHAHAPWNGDEYAHLSEQGLKDAVQVGEILRAIDPSIIYSSPHPRAVETIDPLAKSLQMEICTEPDLRERVLGGGWHGNFEQAVRATWEDFDFAHEGGESNRAAQQRAAGIFRQLVERHPGERIVLSTHGNWLVLLLNQLDPTFAFDFWASVTRPDIYHLELVDGSSPAVERFWEAGQGIAGVG